MPWDRKERFIEDYGLSAYDAGVLTGDRALSEYFEDTAADYGREPKTAANWMINDILGLLNEREISIQELTVAPAQFAEILSLVEEGAINTATGRDLLRELEDAEQSVRTLVEDRGLAQVSDVDELTAICREVIQANPGQAEQYRAGKKAVIGWFIGQVMERTGGKADPQVVRKVLTDLLEEEA
jgi:aspartyl-tRNA(Asn)/glutamyl-tRNA(Gln) amidotransferase subunit B